MTSEALTGRRDAHLRPDDDSIGDAVGAGIVSLERTLRPDDGWVESVVTRR